jgi:hypothetical protein
MGFRHCLNDFPRDLCELPGGPRQGSVNRSGYEIAWDAAGNDFPKGEHDDRTVLTIDNVLQKRRNCWDVFDPTGAAGCGSPRDEVRAFTIDDHNRRARSEPPKHQTMRVSQLQSLQTCGVPLDIDNDLCGRRKRCGIDPSEPTRQQQAHQAMLFGDIECVLVKKHFVGNRGPKELLSPRLESIGLETIDIDSRTRKRQVVEKIAADTVLPTSSCFGLSCEVNHGAWRQAPRSHSFDYFEKTLQTERYATLIGRPNMKSDREFNRARLVALVEQQEKVDASWMLETIIDSEEALAGAEFENCHTMKGRSLSALSTAASESEPLSPKPLSERARIASSGKSNKLAIGEESHEKENALPLGLRRVMASLGNGETLSNSVVKDLTRAIGKQCKGKASVGARLRADSRNHNKA